MGNVEYCGLELFNAGPDGDELLGWAQRYIYESGIIDKINNLTLVFNEYNNLTDDKERARLDELWQPGALLAMACKALNWRSVPEYGSFHIFIQHKKSIKEKQS